MANPYAAQAKSGSAAKMKSMTGKASGGAVYSGETPKFATGGTVSAPGYARGGKAKGKHHKGTHINIAVVAPHGKGAPDEAAGMPPPMPPSAPMAPPPGMGPPGAGGPPGMPPGMPPMQRGGKVHMTAGAANGVGLKQKMRAYGKNARKQTPGE